MRLTTTLLRGRLARRIFLLFVLSALVPIGATAWLSLSQTQRVLTDEAREQLRQSAKIYGMSIHDSLIHSRSELLELAKRLRDQVSTAELLDDADVDWLKAAVLWRASGPTRALKGAIEGVPALVKRFHKDTVRSQTALLWLPEQPDAMYMAAPLAGEAPGKAVLVAQLNPRYLWNRDRLPSASARLCVLDADGHPLYCPHGLASATLQQLRAARAGSSTGQLEWEGKSQEYLGAYWDLFLTARFPNITWTILASQSERVTLHAVENFRRQFPRVVLLSVLLVTFLSVSQIRRTLIPLERLTAGIRRIASGEFESRVAIRSGDEFQELGVAFDGMASRLGRQFSAMSALSRVDQTILTTREIESTLREILEQAPAVVHCDFVCLILADCDAPPAAVAYSLGCASNSGTELRAADVEALRAHPQGILLEDLSTDTAYLRDLRAQGARFVLALPVFLDEQLRGVLALGYSERPIHEAEDQTQALALTHRVALALSLEDWQQRLYHQAHYDSLTWLPNRRLFKKRIQEETLRARGTEAKVGLLFIDLDHFKNVNDSLGHAAGDALLQQAAARLQRCVRDSDTVARLGGDEFAVILTSLPDAESAGLVAQKVIRELSVPFLVTEREVFVGATIGIAICPDDGDNGQELLKKADMALYKAKGAGRNGYSYFEPEMDVRAWERMVLEADLHKALQRGELFLEYQPQLEIGTGLVVGAEALVRWRHPERGLMSPGQFIPLAEQIGLIVPIGEWVLVEACRKYLEWADAGVAPRSVAVNVSAAQFERKDFVQWLQATLAEVGMPPEHLELEITESMLVEDMSGMALLIRELKDLGVRLAIDDFGTKYSSLSYLKSLDVDVLKLDRSFIVDVATQTEAAGIVKAVTQVAHLLKLDVLAEGVETKEQLAQLRALACDQVQGFYFSRPIASADFEKLVRKHGLAIESNVAPLPAPRVRYG